VKYIEVTIREKDKKKKRLTLFNLRDELVNFLYKDTIANSSKTDQRFYVLLYFATLKIGEKTLIEVLFDIALPRFKTLSDNLSNRQGYLAKHEYKASVEEYGLSEFFTYDIFFILCEAVIDIEDIEKKYGQLYRDDTHMQAVIKTLKTDYRPQIIESYSLFNTSRIKDDRTDDDGLVRDLSKGVYRTIKMRNAKNFEVNLQRYTRVKKVTSESPILLEIIQFVDPQIIFDLWNKYHVFDYVADVWRFFNDSPVLSAATGTIIGESVMQKYNAWRGARRGSNKKYKQTSKEAFKVAKSQDSDQLDAINLMLVQSVIDANKHLLEEVGFLKKQLEREQARGAAMNEDEVKLLKTRIEKLENIEVTTSKVKESNHSTSETVEVE
jgi:hypothetical protein